MSGTGFTNEVIDVAEENGWTVGVRGDDNGGPDFSDIQFTRHGRVIETEFDTCGRVWSISEHRAGTFLVFPQHTDSDRPRQHLLDMLRGA